MRYTIELSGNITETGSRNSDDESKLLGIVYNLLEKVVQEVGISDANLYYEVVKAKVDIHKHLHG